MAAHSPLTSLDYSLYCEEGEVLDGDESSELSEITRNSPPLLPPLSLDQGILWEDDELLSLLSKETETCLISLISGPSLSLSRTVAVRWILRVNAHYGFSALTPILAVNYLDRFLSVLTYQEDKPWMIQLASVACLSLAAKVEETHVPLLLDLQVEDADYVFDAKTIQKMELLVLSTLKWKMNPVTPLPFLEHITRKLGLKDHLRWEIFSRCERFILSFLPDLRMVRYLPSVVATATVLHVIHQVGSSNGVDYQNQLFSVLQISKEKVNECYQVMVKELSNRRSNKRSYSREFDPPSSPSGVIDAAESCGAAESSSNHSWCWDTLPPPLYKKRRVGLEAGPEAEAAPLQRWFF